VTRKQWVESTNDVLHRIDEVRDRRDELNGRLGPIYRDVLAEHHRISDEILYLYGTIFELVEARSAFRAQ
jgi:hypothetical protein